VKARGEDKKRINIDDRSLRRRTATLFARSVTGELFKN